MTVIADQSATCANVAASATSVTLFTAAGAVSGRMVFNDSTSVMYLKFGANASATSFTVAVSGGGYYEFPPPVYAGVVDAMWVSATGAARTTVV